MLSPLPRRSDWDHSCSLSQSYQPSPKWPSGRPAQRPLRGLLSVHSRYGLHTRAVTIFCDTLHRRLQPLRYLHSCSGCFRLERLPGGTFTHWKSAALSRRTPGTAISLEPKKNDRMSCHVSHDLNRTHAWVLPNQPCSAPNVFNSKIQRVRFFNPWLPYLIKSNHTNNRV